MEWPSRPYICAFVTLVAAAMCFDCLRQHMLLTNVVLFSRTTICLSIPQAQLMQQLVRCFGLLLR
jgi:hypothetical protein